MNNTLFIADPHFEHANIIRYCNRPYANLAEMRRDLIYKWNSVVTDDDIVYMLGDFSFGPITKIREYVAALAGTKHLVMGNHDRHKPHQYLDCGFVSVSKQPIILDNKYILSHRPIQDTPYINIYGHIHNNPITDYSMDPTRSCCVSVECINYTPITLEAINDRMANNATRI